MRRKVLRLLQDYRSFHTPYGGAMPVDETGVKDASYGAAGYVETGEAFTDKEREFLTPSYKHLDDALYKLETGSPAQRNAYLTLLKPYLGDPGDPSIVDKWNLYPYDCRKEWHDMAIEELAEMLAGKKINVVWPKRMSTRQEKHVDRMNDDAWRIYKQLRAEGKGKTRSVADAALITGYTQRRMWEIVGSREQAEEREAMEDEEHMTEAEKEVRNLKRDNERLRKQLNATTRAIAKGRYLDAEIIAEWPEHTLAEVMSEIHEG